MFPARKNPHFPVPAIWHRDCIDLLVDLTKGITWNACERCVNEDFPPVLTAWTLMEMNHRQLMPVYSTVQKDKV